MAAVRLLGELYNYKLLSSHVVFATLHLVLAHGHEAGTPPEVSRCALLLAAAAAAGGGCLPAALRAAACTPACLPTHPSTLCVPIHPPHPPNPFPSLPPSASRLDPPSNFFRIRLVCTLLEACGQYFTRGAARKKLDRFLPHFQVRRRGCLMVGGRLHRCGGGSTAACPAPRWVGAPVWLLAVVGLHRRV